MKRILALLIVCAMASAASAASIEIDVDGLPYTGQDVEPSQYVTITLYDTVGTYLQTIHPYATISVDNADNYSHAWAPGGMGSSTFTVAGSGYDWQGNQTWSMVQIPGDDVVFAHTFHIPDYKQPSDNILVSYAGQYGGIYAGDINGWYFDSEVLLHVVPEPTTIALLGLGALSLLRRRRK